VRIHLLQLDIAWEDKRANHDRVRSLIEQTEIDRDDLVLLPEMFDTGFSVNTERTNDEDGTSAGFLRTLAHETGAYVQATITALHQSTGRAANRSLTYSPAGGTGETGGAGGLVASYDKAHPFSFGKEHERFDPGSRTATFDWVSGDESLVVMPTVCYDLRFPELYRASISRGAQAFTVLANWPAARIEHWRTLLRARAIENLAYVFAVNRAGSDPHLAYPGCSAVISPDGEILCEMGEDEGVVSIEIEAARVENWRSAFPPLLDRQPVFTPRIADLPSHAHNGEAAH